MATLAHNSWLQKGSEVAGIWTGRHRTLTIKNRQKGRHPYVSVKVSHIYHEAELLGQIVETKREIRPEVPRRAVQTGCCLQCETNNNDRDTGACGLSHGQSWPVSQAVLG